MYQALASRITLSLYSGPFLLQDDVANLSVTETHFFQSYLPARIVVKRSQEGLGTDTEHGLLFFNCLVQPPEGIVDFAAPSVDQGDEIGGFLSVFLR